MASTMNAAPPLNLSPIRSPLNRAPIVGYPVSKSFASPIPTFHRMMGLAVTSLLLMLAILFRAEHISFLKAPDYLPLIEKLAALGLVAAYCHWSKLEKLRDACFLMSWGFILSELLVLPSYAAARSGLPLQDGLLTAMDRSIGIDVGSIVQWVKQYPLIERASIQVYGLMTWLVFAAAVLPALAGKTQAARRFLVSCLLAAVIGSALFAILPAAGPWEGYGFVPYPNHLLASSELRMMRVSSPVEIDPSLSCGLIAFPSFHVALSLLAAFALWSLPWLRWPAVIVAALITLSTMAVGWHYGADVLGGIAVAALAWFLATGSLRRATLRS